MLRSLLLAGVVVAAGGFQGSAPAPPAYDAKFIVPGEQGNQVYTGTTTFVVDGKGIVSGKMELTQPTLVTATLAGSVKDGTWTFEYPYAIPDRNCVGTVKGTGTVPADRKVISGSVTILGGCVDQPLSATYSFTLPEKKGG